MICIGRMFSVLETDSSLSMYTFALGQEEWKTAEKNLGGWANSIFLWFGLNNEVVTPNSLWFSACILAKTKKKKLNGSHCSHEQFQTFLFILV